MTGLIGSISPIFITYSMMLGFSLLLILISHDEMLYAIAAIAALFSFLFAPPWIQIPLSLALLIWQRKIKIS
jgi:hypothetical protein